MTTNNQVILTGNLGNEAKVHEKNDKLFASFSLATHESYKNDQGEYVNKAPIWHNLLVFKPDTVQLAKAFKKGTRLQVTGSLSYREFTHKPSKGKAVKKREASIIAYSIEPKPLAQKQEPKEP